MGAQLGAPGAVGGHLPSCLWQCAPAAHHQATADGTAYTTLAVMSCNLFCLDHQHACALVVQLIAVLLHLTH